MRWLKSQHLPFYGQVDLDIDETFKGLGISCNHEKFTKPANRVKGLSSLCFQVDIFFLILTKPGC